jgi:predicted dehydrogenase
MQEQQTPTVDTVALGLWGGNGHQIHRQLGNYPRLRLVALGGFDPDTERDLHSEFPDASVCADLNELLAVPGLQLVSLCSPMRSEQADHAIAALEAGIHVYAEKPCATTEADLDRILAAAGRSSATFHEMAGTVCEQPYWGMRQLVQDGVIGEVVQVSAQKSYPYHDGRPLDEAVDGGLVAQNGVHALRFIEHVTGIRIATIEALDTPLGDARANSDLRMASSMMGRLENGGVFSVVANYLNPRGFGSWGNEMLRIFGTRGMLESVDGGTRTRLVVGDEDRGAIDISDPAPDWLACVIANAIDQQPMPMDLEAELHPTRLVLRAAANAMSRRQS